MRILTRLFAASLALSLAAGGVALVAPAAHAESVTVDNIEFAWGLNNESSGGAYFGGCNFLSAGIAGDTGSARLWSEADGFFQSSAGNTSIVKPTATRGTVGSTWATKCQTAAGASVNGKVTNAADSYTQSQVRIAGGTGTLDPNSDSASLAWDGAFTVAYYGGMTYWSASNPVLTVSGGTGTLTADLTGFTADMDDPSVWRTIDPAAGVSVTLATFSGVDVTPSGITADPDFLGLTIPDSVSGRNPQAVKTGDNSAWWGAFPAQFLEYQMLTGQSSYWYTTDGGSNSIQPRKVAATFHATAPVTAPTLSPTTAAVGTSVAINASALPADAAVTGMLGDTTLFSSSTDAAGALDTTFTVPEVAVGAHEITVTVSDPATDPPVISTYSATLTVAAAPSAPSRPTVSGISANSATAKWRVPSDSGGIPVTEYTVTVKAAGSSGETTYRVSSSGSGASTESAALDDLKADTTYTVGVTATNPIGTSSASSTRTFTTKTATSTTPTDKPTDDDAAISDATLRWALNAEAGGGAYFGGCNFLSAGLAGDTGSARVWTAADKLYSATSGAVRIEKPDAGGTYRLATWADKCNDRNGDSVSSASVTQSSETQVVISGGTGGTAEDGTVTVEWEGDFTVAFYGGMTYWSASDPVLTIDPDGTGTLTATASGFGADMDDATKWSTLKSRTITLADLSDLDLDAATEDGGFTVTPDYLGVAISSSGGRNNQADKSDANAAYWGSFPASFVDFQIETGQSSYWYTSNGQRDKAKPAAPLTVAYTEDFEVPNPTPPVSTPPTTPPSGGTGPGTGGTGTTTGTGTGTARAGTTGSAAAAAAAADPVTDQNDGTIFQAAASDQQAAAAAAPLRDTAAAVALGAGAVTAALGLSITAGFLIRRLLGLSPSAYL